jgi:sugar lactone lactonase YvrE
MKNFVRLSLPVIAFSALSVVLGPLSVHAQTITTVAGGGPAGAAVIPTAPSIGAPAAVRKDLLGNTYILDNDFGRVYKVDTSGHLTVFAGNGVTGFSGEGGPAVDAAMSGPSGLCIDLSNNVYVADSDNAIIREIPVVTAGGKTAGNIYTVAGVETETDYTYGGDGGPATSANLHFPDGCSFDTNGNLYIADRGNNAIRVVIGTANVPPAGLTGTTIGDIYLYTGATPVPGNPPAVGYAANGTPTVGAALNGPFDVFVDPNNNVFIADLGNPGTTSNQVIREVPATAQTVPFTMVAGEIYTVAGTKQVSGTPTSGVAATSATLNGPEGLFVDANGNLFFCDIGNQVIREVAGRTPTAGMVTGDIYTVAGDGHQGYSGDGGLALSASFSNPAGTFVDSTGLYVADSTDDVVRLVSSSTGNYTTETISTFAGNGIPSFYNATPATAAELDFPGGLAVDSTGDLLIADVGAGGEQSLIRKVASPISTGALTTLVGSPGFNGFLNNNTTDLSFPANVENDAEGVFVDPSGNVFIADTGNCIIREFSAGVMTTIAGIAPTPSSDFPASTPNCGFTSGGGTALTTTLGAVNSVALDAFGDIFFSDSTNNVIWEIPKNTVGSLTAGNAYVVVGTQSTTGAFGGEGGIATSAKLNKPTGIYFDVYGNLFIADTGNNLVREVPSDNTGSMTAGNIYTVAGDLANQSAGYSGNNGVATSAQLNAPYTMVVDNAENIFIADTNNQVIRQVAGTATGKTKGDIYTVVGTNVEGFAGDGGAATSAQLDTPQGLAIDGSGNLLISDGSNNRVRSVSAIANVSAVPVASFDATSLTFLPQPVNIPSTAQTVKLSNNGGATLTGIAVTITGTNAADFGQTNTCTATLAAGANCTISVTFTPAAVGAFTAKLSIADNAFGNPQTIGLSGTGQVGTPVAVVTPNPIAFTPQTVGVASTALPVIVSNATGTGVLTISSIGFTGTNATDFSQTNNCGTLPAAVAAGASCTINVVFNPTSVTPAARTANLVVTDTAANSPQTVPITGTAIQAAITINPTSLTFASQSAGTASAPQPIAVTNSGTAALTFTSITIGGPNAADFTLGSATNCGGTGTLNAGTNCTLSVVYKPAAAGTSTAMITLADNVSTGSQTINLTGTATAAVLSLNLGAASGSSLSQTVTAGQTANYSLQISANENASVTFTCSGAPTAATCNVPTTAVAVTAGTPAAVAVTVTTTANGLLVPQSEPATRMQPPAGIQMLPISVLAVLLLIVSLLAKTQSPVGRLRVARVALSACLVLMPIAAATLLVGCGGGGSSSTPPPPPQSGTPTGTYTVTVTATSGSQTATTKLTLIVQ